MQESNFFTLIAKLGVTHHSPRNIQIYLEKVIFKKSQVEFTGKKMLDIGGGRGLCSFYGVHCGAQKVENVEPHFAGSDGSARNIFEKAMKVLGHGKTTLVDQNIQNFLKQCDRYDIIVLHDSINHLNEEQYQKLNKSQTAFNRYVELFANIAGKHNENGQLIIADCARRNFFGDLGVNSPFAPSIEWHLHQDPIVISKILKAAGYEDIKWRWTPLKRLGEFGYYLSGLGRIPSYFLQSHFVLFARKK